VRVLILAHFYPPEMGGAAARLHGLARWLAQYGHRVTVVTGFPNYPTGVVPPSYRGKMRVRETLDGVDVLRTWVYASSHRSSVRRLANYLSFVISATVTGLTAGQTYDVVLASSPPLFIGVAGMALARLLCIPFVFDIRDIWPELAVEAGEFEPTSAIVRWGERLEHFLYCQATHITVVTKGKRRKLAAKGVPESQMSVVCNGVDLELLCTTGGPDWRRELDLDGKFVIVYAGLIGVFQGVEVMVDAASALREREDIHFLIVGDGVRRSELEERAERERLANITFLSPQPHKVIPSILSAADVALVPLVNSQLVDAVPSKLLEAWGCRRSVILVAGGEARRLVEEAQAGVVVPPEESEKLAPVILQMASDRVKLGRFADRGYRYVSRYFDRPKLARKMESVLRYAIGEAGSIA
jgi:colanic acid biosynthesis glycosyl transferase WcaI